jgi:hypothetical protein
MHHARTAHLAPSLVRVLARLRAGLPAVVLLTSLVAALGGCSDDAGDPPASGPCAKAGVACDDGNLCTENDTCAGGKCSGLAKVCDDGLACTTDSCDGQKGCITVTAADFCAIDKICISKGAGKAGDVCAVCNPALSTSAWSPAPSGDCDDGDACTTADRCQATGCKGDAVPCDDNNPCTADSCGNAGACSHAATGGPCEDGEPCTAGDTCSAGKCDAGKDKPTCDDGDTCTADSCKKGKGCEHVADAKICDDAKPCTTDTCTKAAGCSHVNKKPGDACGDGNPCVVDQVCSLELQCTGGGPLPCDDNNGCTTDSCKAGKGCVHTLNELPCDDGLACTWTDLCTGGQCIGLKTQQCNQCTKNFGDTAAKLTTFQVGASGEKGQGLDLDGNPDTCAPAANCSDGIDNAASALAFFLNQPLQEASKNGSLSFAAEFDGYVGENIPFTLNLYYVEPVDPFCQPLNQSCQYLAGQTAMSADCKPKFSFANATVVAGKLVAGGADTLFAMDADLIGAESATLFVTGARIQGDVTFAADGLTVLAVDGVLGGAVPQKAVTDIVGALDESLFAGFGLTKPEVLLLIEDLLEKDVDIDGDGEGDASSIGLRFSGVGAEIIGFD